MTIFKSNNARREISTTWNIDTMKKWAIEDSCLRLKTVIFYREKLRKSNAQINAKEEKLKEFKHVAIAYDLANKGLFKKYNKMELDYDYLAKEKMNKKRAKERLTVCTNTNERFRECIAANERICKYLMRVG